MGEEGIEILNLFFLLDGQRIQGFADVGDINFLAIQMLFDLYAISDEKRQEVFESILTIDRIARKYRQKQDQDGDNIRARFKG